MASPLFDAISVQHSRFIGDSVAAAATDGKVWSSAQRSNQINLAIRRLIDKHLKRALAADKAGMDASWHYGFLQGYITEEAQSLSASVKALSSWTGGVAYIFSVKNGSTFVKPISQERKTFSDVELNDYLKTSSTNQFWLLEAGDIHVLGCGATDSVTLRYLKQHTDLSAGGATDILIPNQYNDEILQTSELMYLKEKADQMSLARAQVLEQTIEAGLNV